MTPTLGPGAAILTDFDGTLSAIAAHPEQAVPVEGAVEVLSALAAEDRRVAVVSGRPVAFLTRHLPDPRVELAGLYGLEGRIRGRLWSAPGVEEWRSVVAASVQRGVEHFAGVEGVLVEPKGLSLTIHYRSAESRAGEVVRWATAEAERTSLDLRRAKASLELHPPVSIDKGTVVERIGAEHDPVAYLGDDVGDLPAFDALDRLADRRHRTLRVVVRSLELPDEVEQRADLVLDSPRAVVDFLRRQLA